MKRIQIKQTKEYIGQEVTLAGFVQEIRDQSKIKFLVLRDITQTIQCVTTNQALFPQIAELTKESVIQILGSIKAEKQAPGGIELDIKEISVLSLAQPLPIQVVRDETTLPIRLDYRWIDLRKSAQASIFKIQSFIEYQMMQWWKEREFIQIHSPKFMGTPSESGAELFEVEYFGKKAYLAQSPQFYKQMAMASGFEKIFEIGPVFRANPSHTTRHDTEFTMIDMEISYIESSEDVMKLEEEWLHHIIKQTQEAYGEIIKKEFGVEIVVPTTPFPRIELAELLKILKQKYSYLSPSGDLDAAGEKLAAEYIKQTYGHEFVFITRYPIDIRPYYHQRIGDKTDSFDLLYKGVEITTGAKREHRYEILKEQAIQKGLSVEPKKHYLDFFRYGCPPHGGFAVSISRILMLLLELQNVREATFLPRDTSRLTP